MKDLFYNTPARKKFLKSTATELYHIIDIVTKESLSHWDTGFTLMTDNKETLQAPPSSGPKERIMQIYGEDFVRGLTEAFARKEPGYNASPMYPEAPTSGVPNHISSSF